MNFFYDGQIRRYLVQFIRIFSDIKIETTKDGVSIQSRVPITYGDPSWQVAQIIKGNNENSMLPSPMFSAWISDINLSPARRQDPQFIGKRSTIEREFDDTTQSYTSNPGNRYSIDRYMPVPYDVTFQLDLWTTNTTTKLQILEQILTIFNPSIQLQQNQNPFDWSSIFEVELTDVTWTNRSIGSQQTIERDVASLQFTVPIWINPPAKLKRVKLINQIVQNVHESNKLSGEDLDNVLDPFNSGNTNADDNSGNYGNIANNITDGRNDGQNSVININGYHIDPGDHLSGQVKAPGNFKISIGINDNSGDEIVLLDSSGRYDETLSWKDLFAVYGKIDSDTTIIKLKKNGSSIDDNEDDIIGRVSIDPNRSNILLFELDEDTLPSTIPSGPIDKIIDPTKNLPGKDLPVAVAGQRYIINSNISHPDEKAIPDSSPWGNIVAHNNDIIEYNGVGWFVSFSSNDETVDQYVVNLDNMIHYRFVGDKWEYTYYGEYTSKNWKLSFLSNE